MKNKSGNSCYREAVNIHSSLELSFILHKYHLRVDEKKSRNVFSAIRDELILDGDSRQNLATFCQTWLDDEIRELLNLAIDKNMIYKDEYPQMAEPEGRCVLMNPLMILVKIIKLRWIHILSYDQMVSRKINNQTTRCANSIFYTTLFTNSAPNYT
ncbi:hypothetical protein ED309_14280 [Escherichia coli]|nr:hypothetical protein [Escherichia coli]